MGVSKTITVVCDYKNCKGTNGVPAVLSWNETAVSNGQAEPPEEAKYIVSFSQATTQGNRLFSFCCQLHAAEFFLPPGYEAKQKKVIDLSKKDVDEILPPWAKIKDADWKDEPHRIEQPNDQPDGFAG